MKIVQSLKLKKFKARSTEFLGSSHRLLNPLNIERSTLN